MKLSKNEIKTVERILGWKPNKTMCLSILEEIKKGKSIEQACYERSMPDIIILEDDELPPPPDHPLQKRILTHGPNYQHKEQLK